MEIESAARKNNNADSHKLIRKHVYQKLKARAVPNRAHKRRCKNIFVVFYVVNTRRRKYQYFPRDLVAVIVKDLVSWNKKVPSKK